LIDNHITYFSQKTFEDCRNINVLPFDFYLPEFNTCIEFDGRQHFEVVDAFGGIKDFEKLKINDIIKNKYCSDNGIRLIRIKFNNIKNDILQIYSLFKSKLI
jgi:very-short-patch-repair endonuclease